MHDIKLIRKDPAQFDAELARRGLGPMSADILALDAEHRDTQTRAREVQTRRNQAAKEIGQIRSGGGDVSGLIAEASRSKEEQAALEEESRQASEKLNEVLTAIPNVLLDSVPQGRDSAANVEIRKWAEPTAFTFEPKEHFEIGQSLGLMDFKSAARMSGSRFVVLLGELARLERALANFMLNMHTGAFGFTEVNPPALVRDAACFGAGQLPKFSDDLFHTDNGYWLIPTAEVPLANMVADDILDEKTLPRRYTAATWCFRSEAGAAGKDTRGMIRQHQFTKVEMVCVTTPEASSEELERITSCAESVLRALSLPYRTVALCAGDMGFSACKTYDIEVWLPGQGRYREISSCSNCGDFQARRMMARFRRKGDKKTRFVHTLNGSGLAVGRTLAAVLENYQQADGSVVVPEALRPYMGIEVIAPHA